SGGGSRELRIVIRLCISSQTPPLEPKAPPSAAGHHHAWRLGSDYTPNVGGVVPMMRALIHQSVGRWVAPNPRWVALGTSRLPAVLRTDEGYTLETVPFPEAERAPYRRFKDAIWSSFHGPSGLRFPAEDYRAFVNYNYRMADALLRHADDYNLFYVNDFQQILVGGLIGSAAPALLRWHIPVDFKGYSEPVRRFF
ncbi:glycosyl transferase group 1, partial [mine drainage metagenome]